MKIEYNLNDAIEEGEVVALYEANTGKKDISTNRILSGKNVGAELRYCFHAVFAA